jgi:hypothetical protein
MGEKAEFLKTIEFIYQLLCDAEYNISAGEFYYAINDLKYLIRETEKIQLQCKHQIEFIDPKNAV